LGKTWGLVVWQVWGRPCFWAKNGGGDLETFDKVVKLTKIYTKLTKRGEIALE